MPYPKLLSLTVKYDVQLNVRPTTCREGTQEEQGHSSASSAVDGIGGARYTLAALPPGESPGIYSLVGPMAYLYDNGKDFLSQRGSNSEPLSL